MTNDLRKLSEWMKEYRVTAVAMESTGIYWKPIFNILEDDFDIVLANAQHIKNILGRKTDVKDCKWIAHLFRNGLVSGSFIPPREIRELRDLIRTRRKLVDAMASEKSRVQKVLEDAKIKISSVVSKVFGVSSLMSALSGVRTRLSTPMYISGCTSGSPGQGQCFISVTMAQAYIHRVPLRTTSSGDNDQAHLLLRSAAD